MNLTGQDLIKGQDFTAFNPQTATQHNQLVDAATPWTDPDDPDDAQGVGLLLTTTDTYVGPNVPYVPMQSKWKRYLWLRRPYNDPSITDTSCKVYAWNDAAVEDSQFSKWQLVDPASQVTMPDASRTITDGQAVNGSYNFTSPAQADFTAADLGKYISGPGLPVGTIIAAVTSSSVVVMSNRATDNFSGATYTIQYKQGSPLEAALNYAVDTANNAYSTAIAASNNVAALQSACLTSSPSTVSPPLETQIGNNTASIGANTNSINTVWLNISGDLTNINAKTTNGTINWRLDHLETNVTNIQNSTTDISKIVPGPAGYSLRTNAATTPAVVWFDPRAQDETMVVTAAASSGGALSAFVVNGASSGAPSIGAVTGTYLVQFWATCWGNYGGGGTNIQMRLNVGGQNVDSSIVNSGTNSTVPVTLVGIGYVKLSSGSGVALAGSMLQGSLAAGGTLLFILRKISPVST